MEKIVCEAGINMNPTSDRSAWKKPIKESSEEAFSSKLLRIVSTKEAFHFYTDIGQYYARALIFHFRLHKG